MRAGHALTLARQHLQEIAPINAQRACSGHARSELCERSRAILRLRFTNAKPATRRDASEAGGAMSMDQLSKPVLGTDVLHQVFPGESSLAARMRDFDWQRTPLGPVRRWPQNLRVALGICLTSRFPMQVWWGRALTMFYNDAFVPLLGRVKHPVALGGSARDAWPEIWTTIGPMIDGVRAHGAASWSEDMAMFFDRALPREEVYVTLSFSPIFGAQQQVDGVFCACTETTEKLIGARRLEMLSRLGIHAASCNDAGSACQAAVEVLATNPHDIPFAAIYTVDAEQHGATLISSTGLPLGHELPHHLSLHEDAHEHWALARVLTTRTSCILPLAQCDLRLPSGPWREPATHAMLLPVGGATSEATTGLLVLGVSPRRPLDAQYGAFFEMVARHIGAALADAQGYEAERRRAELLSELNRAKTAFFTHVSHEFRTPLTLMLGPLEEALADLPREMSATHAHLEMVRRNAHRLHKLVNTLLELAPVETGRVKAHFEATDLTVMTRELAGLFRSATERAGLALEVRCDPLPQPVFVDRAMWEKIVLNLLSNALKFTSKAGSSSACMR